MKKAKLLSKLEDLLSSPSFTIKEAEARGVSRQALARYAKEGKLERVSPGVYCSPSYELNVDFEWEDLIRITFTVDHGVVCLITALSIYELTDEISREFWLAIPHKKRAPKLANVRIVRMRNMVTGVTTKKIGDYKISIFDPERTVIDAFRYLDKELAIIALKKLSQKKLNLKKIREYSKILKINIDPYLLTVSA